MPRTLLLADDSETIRKVVAIVFAHEDFQVTAVANGDDAIARARELNPDIVLADVVMPGRDGYEVCQTLKADPATSGIPVLLLAGTFEPFDEVRAQEVGADGHLPKPFESARLIEKVRELVGASAEPTRAPAPVAQAVAPAAPQRPSIPMPPGMAPFPQTSTAAGVQRPFGAQPQMAGPGPSMPRPPAPHGASVPGALVGGPAGASLPPPPGFGPGAQARSPSFGAGSPATPPPGFASRPAPPPFTGATGQPSPFSAPVAQPPFSGTAGATGQPSPFSTPVAQPPFSGAAGATGQPSPFSAPVAQPPFSGAAGATGQPSPFSAPVAQPPFSGAAGAQAQAPQAPPPAPWAAKASAPLAPGSMGGPAQPPAWQAPRPPASVIVPPAVAESDLPFASAPTPPSPWKIPDELETTPSREEDDDVEEEISLDDEIHVDVDFDATSHVLGSPVGDLPETEASEVADTWQAKASEAPVPNTGAAGIEVDAVPGLELSLDVDAGAEIVTLSDMEEDFDQDQGRGFDRPAAFGSEFETHRRQEEIPTREVGTPLMAAEGAAVAQPPVDAFSATVAAAVEAGAEGAAFPATVAATVEGGAEGAAFSTAPAEVEDFAVRASTDAFPTTSVSAPRAAGVGSGVAPVAAAADGGEAALRAALSAASREVIERIAWEVVPQLAEVILREHVERLVKSREQGS